MGGGANGDEQEVFNALRCRCLGEFEKAAQSVYYGFLFGKCRIGTPRPAGCLTSASRYLNVKLCLARSSIRTGSLVRYAQQCEAKANNDTSASAMRAKVLGRSWYIYRYFLLIVFACTPFGPAFSQNSSACLMVQFHSEIMENSISNGKGPTRSALYIRALCTL